MAWQGHVQIFRSNLSAFNDLLVQTTRAHSDISPIVFPDSLIDAGRFGRGKKSRG
jgi:hypothetical protein